MADTTIMVRVGTDVKPLEALPAAMQAVVKKAVASLDQVREKADVIGKSTGPDGLAAKFKDLQGSIGQTHEVLGKLGGGAGADGLGKLSGAAGNLGSKMSALPALINPVTLGIAAIAVAVFGSIYALNKLTDAALTMGKEASAAFATLQNKTGATGETLAGLEANLRHVGASSTQSLGEIAPVMAALNARTGQTGAALEGLTKQVSQLSKVTGTDAVQNVALVTRMFGDWGVSTDQQAGKLDMLFRASQKTGVGVDELSRLVVQFGAPLRNFGFSMEEGVTMLGKWQKEGVNTELVMGSLRIASGKFAKEGIDLREGLRGAITAIKEAGTSSEATAKAMEIFGARAGADMADTIRGGKFAYEDLLGAIKGGEGTIAEAAEAAAGLGGQWKKMHNAVTSALSPMTDLIFDFATKAAMGLSAPFSKVANAVGDKLAPLAASAREALMPLAEAIGPMMMRAADQIIPKLQVLGDFLLSAFTKWREGGGPEALLGAMQKVGDVIAWVAGKVGDLIGWMTTHSGVVMTVVKGLGLMIGVFVAVGAIIMGAVVVALVLVAAQFALLGVAVIKLAQLAKAAWTEIKAAVSTGAAAVKGYVTALWTDITTAWSTGVAAVEAFGAALWADVQAKWNGILAAVTMAATALWLLVQSKWAAGVAYVKAAGAALWADIVATWNGIKTTVTTLAGALWTWLVSSFEAVKTALIDGVTFVANAFKAAWTWIVTTISTIVATIVNWIKDKWAWLGNTLSSIMGKVADMFSAAWTWIHDTVGKAASKIANAVSKVFHWLGQTLGAIWDKVGDLFNSAWAFIVDVFRKYAGPIVSGVRSVFVAVVTAISNAMNAAGGIVQRAIEWILAKIQSAAAVLSYIMPGLAGMVSAAVNAVRAGAADLATFANGVIASIKGGVGDAMDFFGAKIAAGRAGLAKFFSGSASQTADPGNAARQQMARSEGIDAGPDVGGLTGGGGADLSGLGGGEKGGGAFQAPDGMSGKDADGSEWYIDPATGKKTYTSGPKLNVQNARLAGIDAKKQEAEAKRAAAKAKLASGGKEADVATTMANIAEKVSGAVQAGLDAIQALTEADLPGRDRWQPKLDAVVVFVSESLSKFDTLGQQLLEHIGPLDDGAQLMDTVKVKAIAGVVALTGGLLETMSKASGFLQGLVKAKWPAPGQVDAAFVLVIDTLRRVRDAGQDLAGVFGEGPKKEGDSDPLARFAAVGTAMATWSDLWGKIVDGAIRMGASAKELASAPAAMKLAEAVLDELTTYTRGMVTALQAATPDEDAQQASMFASRTIGQTFSVWADLMVKLGDGARSLADLPRIPAGAAGMAWKFLSEVGALTWALVKPIQDAYPTRQEQEDAMAVHAQMAETLTAAIGPFERVAAVARSLRSVLRIPDGAAAAVGAFLGQVSGILNGFLSGEYEGKKYDLRADAEKSIEGLGVVSAMTASLAAGVDLIGNASNAMRGLVDLPAIPDGTLARVQSTIAAVAMILSGMVSGKTAKGEDWDLRKDVPAATAAFNVIGQATASTAAGVSLISDIAKLGATLADAEPLSADDVQRALDNAAMVRDLVTKAAGVYAKALTDSGQDWQDVQELVGPFAAAIKATADGFAEAAKVKIGEVLPIDMASAEQAIDNAVNVDAMMREWGGRWRDGFGNDAKVIAQVVADTAVFAGQLKTVGEAFNAAAAITVGEVKPIDMAAMRQAIENAVLVADEFELWAKDWADTLRANKQHVDDVAKLSKDYEDHVKGALDLVNAAAGFGLEAVKPISSQDVSTAMSNADMARTRVADMAQAWRASILGQRGDVDAVVKEGEDFAKSVNSALDLLTAAAGLALDGVKQISIADVDQAFANAMLVYDQIRKGAEKWAKDIAASGRATAAVTTEMEAFSKVVGSAADVLTKTNAALQAMADKTPPTNLKAAITNLKDQAIFMVQELADAFETIERKQGSLEKAGKAAGVIGPAADALGKVLDALSFDKLLASPLIVTKVRSGWMNKVAADRMKALGIQITEGIKLTVKTLVDGLSEVKIPDDATAPLDKLATVYERLVAIFERIRDLMKDGTPDVSGVRDLVAMIQQLAAGIGGLPALPGAPPPGGGAGAPGSPGSGGPGGGAPGGGMGTPFQPPQVPPGGGLPPIIIMPPPSPNVNVQIDSEDLIFKMSRLTGFDRARSESFTPQGS